MTDKELRVQGKQEVEQNGEPTKPVRQFVPAVDICETGEAVTVYAEMPGVNRSGVEIHLEDGVLSIRGQMAKDSGPKGKILMREYENGDYTRRFSISEHIDQEKIEAVMTDGVLRLVLPKIAPAKPRKIEVKAE